MSLNSHFHLPKWLDSQVQYKEDTTLNFLPNTIDLSKVQALLYHFPDGKVIRLEIKDIEQLNSLELEIGRYCDTSAINGILHFYPRGNT
jgi:hypothetical protein